MLSARHAPRIVTRSMCSVVGMTLILLLWGARPANAHNTIINSSPRDGDVLVTTPPTWSIEFAKDVPLPSASAEIVLSDGVRRRLETPRHGTSARVVVFDLPAPLSGNVTARWRLVGTDGHVISGRVSFTVMADGIAMPQAQQPVAAPTADVKTLDANGLAVPEPVRVVVRYINYSALLLLGGLLFAELYVAAGAVATVIGRRLLVGGAFTLATGSLVSFITFVTDLRDGSNSLVEATSGALGLTPGGMLLFRVLSSFAVVGGLLRFWRVNPVNDVRSTDGLCTRMALLLVLYAVAMAFGGHSRSQRASWLGIPADVLHVSAAAVWIGGLIALLAVVIPAVDTNQAMQALDRFSVSAQRAVGVIVVTGLVQSIRLHGRVWSIASTSHGRLLLLKVTIVVMMLTLGARNRRRLIERRRTTTHDEVTKAAVLRSSLIEVGFGAAAITVTAILVALSPE